MHRGRVPGVITLSSLIMPIFEFQAPLIEHRVSHTNFTYQIQSSTDFHYRSLHSVVSLQRNLFEFLLKNYPGKWVEKMFPTCFYHHGGIRIKTNCSLILGRVCSGRVAPLIFSRSRLVMLQIYAISLVIPIFILVVKLTIIIPR